MCVRETEREREREREADRQTNRQRKKERKKERKIKSKTRRTAPGRWGGRGRRERNREGRAWEKGKWVALRALQ